MDKGTFDFSERHGSQLLDLRMALRTTPAVQCACGSR